MIPNNQATVEAVPTDSTSDPVQGIWGTGWIQPSLTKIDLGGSPVGIVDNLYVRYEPEIELADWAASLDAMAEDLQIRREIASIEEEFASTLQDGLEDEP